MAHLTVENANAQTAAQTVARPDILPAWTPPKTDWRKTDVFDLTPDYARVRGNILHLREAAVRLYLPFGLAPMCDYAVEDVPGAAFFEAVDGNTDALLHATFRPPGTPGARAYAENGSVWTADDLNRIEGAHAALRACYTAQENGRTALSFTMGGGLLGACL